MAVNSFFDCGASCTAFTFPALPADPNCVVTPTTSEVKFLWIRPKLTDGSGNYADDPFTTWGTGGAGTGVTITAGAVDNTTTDNTKSHQLHGIGTLPAAEKQVIATPGFGQITTLRTYTLNFQITSIPDSVYEYLLALQCGKVDWFKFYYADQTYAYGKDGGILPNVVDVDFVKESGKAAVNTANLIVTWDSLGDPERRNNPYA